MTITAHKLFGQIRADFPDIDFVESSRFAWHAGNRHITYSPAVLEDERSIWALLHELGHAQLGHIDYTTDIELLQLEVAAWVKAHELASRYDVTIDQDYIEDCTDSYRDWLHVRATCPTCFCRALQHDKRTYHCHNCSTEWQVTRSRLCRPYRKRRGSFL